MGSPSITTRELSRAIGREVSRFTARPVRGAPHGYMADIYRLELSGVDVPDTLIMKVASSDPERRAIAERFGSYQNEQHFYTSLNQNLPFRVPHTMPPTAMTTFISINGRTRCLLTWTIAWIT